MVCELYINKAVYKQNNNRQLRAPWLRPWAVGYPLSQGVCSHAQGRGLMYLTKYTKIKCPNVELACTKKPVGLGINFPS